MSIRAYPKLAAPGVFRFWAGTRSSASMPRLAFTLNGASQQPSVVRAWQSVRSPDLVPEREPRAYSGVFEFTGFAEGVLREVRVAADREPGVAVVRGKTLPRALPNALDS